MRERRTTPLPYEQVPPAPPDDPFDEYERTLGELVAALEAAPGATVWTWWPPDQSVAFWTRRMAHETSVHRWDAQRALGDPRPVDAVRAVDGIDESLTVFLGEYLRDNPQDGLAGTATLTATDTGDTFTVTLRPDGADVARDAAAAGADAILRAPASDLWLALWGRGTPVETAGDERIVQLLTE